MMTNEELKPCPFCGKAAKLEELGDHHGPYYNLGCSDSKCPAHHVFYTMTEEDMPMVEAVKTWNWRPEEDNIAAAVRREIAGGGWRGRRY